MQRESSLMKGKLLTMGASKTKPIFTVSDATKEKKKMSSKKVLFMSSHTCECDRGSFLYCGCNVIILFRKPHLIQSISHQARRCAARRLYGSSVFEPLLIG